MRASSREDDARDTVIVLALVVAIVLAAAYWVSRIAFENPLLPVAFALGIVAFHLTTPLFAAQRLARAGRTEWWASQPLLMILAVGFTSLLGFGARLTGISAAPIITVFGLVAGLYVLARWARRASARSTFSFLVLAAALGAWAAGVVWGTRYKLPLYWERVALDANVHHDPIYYAAIGNMMRTYGVPSTGLDGVPYIHYHYGASWLFAQWSDLAGIDVMTFYNLGYPIIVIPMFFCALLLVGVEVAAGLRADASEQPFRKQYIVWLALAAALIGFLPEAALYALTIWHAHLLISESYLTGLVVFLLAIGTATVWWRRRRDGNGRMGKRRDIVFLAGFVPLVLGAAGFLKISLMILLLAAGIYAALRLKLFPEWRTWVAAILAIAVCALVYRAVSLPEQNQGVVPFAFIRSQVARGWGPFFIVLHFGWTWLYIGLRLWEERVMTLGDMFAAITQRRLIDAEIVLVLAVLGFLPGEILEIHGGSAFYFSDVQRWAALALIMGRSSVWLGEWRARRVAVMDPQAVAPRGGRFGSARIATAIAVLVAAPFAATLVLNAVRPPIRLARANIALRRDVAELGGSAAAAVPRLFDAATLDLGLHRARYYSLVTALRSLGRLPHGESRNAALFIPQSNQLFWSMFDFDGRCTFVPLVAPAFSGLAMLDGMPPRGCALTDQYNMSVYRARTSGTSAGNSVPALCAAASRKGFREVFVLESAPGGSTTTRKVVCG